MNDQSEILNYFQQFLSEHKINLFNSIAQERTRHFTFVLEDLFHPHNASAVLRTCDCFGIQDVHMIENNHEFVNEEDISLGSFKWLSVKHHNDLDSNSPKCFEQLRNEGYTIAALSPHHNDMLIDDYPIENKTAFILGAEKNGLSEYSLNNADVYVKVPMYGFTESYNVSVSAAMVMHNTVQRLRKSNTNWQLNEQEQWEVKLAWTLRTIQSSSDIIKRYLRENPEAAAFFPFSKYI